METCARQVRAKVKLLELFSYGDRLVLINSVLSSLPMFLLSFFEIPVGVKKRLDFYRSRFFWQSDQTKKKYRLTKWNLVCRPKDQGGLGIEVLDVKNKCLLSKWLFKLLTEQGVWHELLHNKYIQGKPLSQVEAKPTDSPFWKGIMGVKKDFFDRISVSLGNGLSVRFWEDPWLSETPLAFQYPSLYNIVRNKNVLVAHVLDHDHPNLQFRRALVDNKWEAWLHLVERLMAVSLSNEPDSFSWKLTPSGVFSVRSMYADLMNGNTVFLRKYLWKLKVPLKIKIFMWFLHRKELLTKDNLAKRRWMGSKKCVFCDLDESVDHLFIRCSFARQIWRLVHFTFSITPPTSATNLFGNWLNGVDKTTKDSIRVGVCAFLWAIWNCRNDVIFNNMEVGHFLQVVHRATH